LLDDTKEVKMNIPVKLTGTAAGVLKGGKLVQRLSHVLVKALPKNMPETITIDITDLDVGKSVRVSDIVKTNFEVLKAPSVPIASIEVTRAMKEQENTAKK
jgi:large subunit ribosomal protein L25